MKNETVNGDEDYCITGCLQNARTKRKCPSRKIKRNPLLLRLTYSISTYAVATCRFTSILYFCLFSLLRLILSLAYCSFLCYSFIFLISLLLFTIHSFASWSLKKLMSPYLQLVYFFFYPRSPTHSYFFTCPHDLNLPSRI